MTRTARAAYPRAVIKDRSESRNGSDPSMRKAGAGHHNWGSLDHERQLEEDAIVDEEILEAIGDEETPLSTSSGSVDSNRSVSPHRQTENTKVLTPEEVERARNFRKSALKGVDIDLTAIARTSSAVLTLSPVSPVAVRDGHDNKQIPIHSV